MESFRLLTQKGSEGLAFYSDGELVHYRSGDKVRVTEGPLKGAEGYIKRIKKDKRLLVCIEGVIAVATSYIPAKMLEPITE
jgi:ribosomal protein L24